MQGFARESRESREDEEAHRFDERSYDLGVSRRVKIALVVATLGLASAVGVSGLVHSSSEEPPGPTHEQAVSPTQPELPPKTAYHPVIRVPATQPSVSPEDQQILDEQRDALMRSMGDR